MNISPATITSTLQKSAKWLLLSSTIILLSVNFGLIGKATGLESCANQEVIAHRGSFDRYNTENTMRAYRKAVAEGANVIESDMRLTKDGQWVMMHDKTIRRTTNKRGYVKNLSLARIKSARTNDGVLGGVPTLDETLAYMATQPSVKLLFEIKPPSSELSNAQLQALLAKFTRAGVMDRTTFESFDSAMLTRLHTLNPAIKSLYLVNTAVDPATVLANGSTSVGIKKTIITQAMVNTMRAAGIKVNIWTVLTDAEWQTSVTLGVDGIITDIPSKVEQLCQTAVRAAAPTAPPTTPVLPQETQMTAPVQTAPTDTSEQPTETTPPVTPTPEVPVTEAPAPTPVNPSTPTAPAQTPDPTPVPVPVVNN